MIRAFDTAGRVTSAHDDVARTVTTYDETGAVTSTRPYTEAENAAADQQISDAARLDDLAAKVALLWAAVFPPDPEPEPGEPVTAPEFSGIWHPGTLISDGGKTWLNTSGVPLTTPPSGFPGSPSQWGHLFVEVTSDPDPEPEPGDRPAWAEGIAYAVGDEVTHDGRAWRCKLAHTSHTGWAPSAATHAVWTDLGPA